MESAPFPNLEKAPFGPQTRVRGGRGIFAGRQNGAFFNKRRRDSAAQAPTPRSQGTLRTASASSTGPIDAGAARGQSQRTNSLSE
jgi:hypothetical protein